MSANPGQTLLRYYVDNSRRLPWRSPPGALPPDPYRVWLSEVMLQQTTVATVIPRFERFVARWPDIVALAAAPDEAVMQEWAGLGYYARARNLLACARRVAAMGRFPTTADELRGLPGLGAYSAAAIAAIAFGEQVAPVDTNVTRVLARWHGLPQPSRKEIARIFLDHCSPCRAGDFAQALMDLGATVCRVRTPECERCPVMTECAAFRSGTPDQFPVPKPRAARPQRFGTAWWIEQNDAVWLVRRPDSGLLGGMAALPGTAWTAEPATPAVRLGSVRHLFTHFALDLAVERRADPVGDGWWQPLDRLDEAGLPTLYRRVSALALAAPRARLEVGQATP